MPGHNYHFCSFLFSKCLNLNDKIILLTTAINVSPLGYVQFVLSFQASVNRWGILVFFLKVFGYFHDLWNQRQRNWYHLYFLRSSWVPSLLHTLESECSCVTCVSRILAILITKPPFKACLNQQRNWFVHNTEGFKGSNLVCTQLVPELQSPCLSVSLSPSLHYASPCMTFISQTGIFIVG